jgi:predicted 3-demethylubiquinone-9 3-methyltransferase (glyoxalase superfamily)
MMTQKITTFLWFDGAAEEAARFYVSLFPESRIDKVVRSPVETPGAPAGSALTVEFTLAGEKYIAMNGGPGHPFTDAISLQVNCDDQAEVDRLWAAFGEGGTPVACGWITDRFGLSWQVTPKRLMQLLADSDPGRSKRAMEAMMEMVKIDISALERAADSAT